MEGGVGAVKHIVLGRFKEGITGEQIDELVKRYANLVNLIHPMKSFRWGKDVSIENLQQGFTHVFESTFDSTEAVAEYVSHPVHVEFGATLLASLDKILVIDYKPSTVQL